MRLLRYEIGDDISLTSEEFYDKNVPPYAILSHTWGPDEVFFQDIRDGTAQTREGYSKVSFCAKQAARDGLNYFWVDTCCINRSSSAELQEAINSMFSWYKAAKTCYVYLSDVSISRNSVLVENSWETAFRDSRWFTRGWTLQELIAPASVVFFSVEGTRLGDKHSLVELINEVTGIPIATLRGISLSEFSIEERMSWMKSRETSCGEDAAYCLLGLFDVHMPLLYGEGKSNATRRLLNEIHKSHAPFFGDLSHSQGSTRTSVLPFKERHELTPGASAAVYEIPIDALMNTDSEAGSDVPTDAGMDTNSEAGTGIPIDADMDTDSEAGTDIATIFSDSGNSTSSTSTASLNPIRTSGIREVSSALLSHEDLKTLCRAAVRNVDRRKARVHLRGFLRDYGRDLLQEASNETLRVQAAKFVQELAGRIADEIHWNITEFQGLQSHLEPRLAKRKMESWLSSIEPQDVEPELRSSAVRPVYEEVDSDVEMDSDIQYPNLESVREFLLKSEALEKLVAVMRAWLKVGGDHGKDGGDSPSDMPIVVKDDPAKSPTEMEIEEEPSSRHSDSKTPTKDQDLIEDKERLANEVRADPQSRIAISPQRRSTLPRTRDILSDLITTLLDYWGISFFVYDLVDLFIPSLERGSTRLRWRCSCGTILWGDFPSDDEHALHHLKHDLSRGGRAFASLPGTESSTIRHASNEQHAPVTEAIQLNTVNRTLPTSADQGGRSSVHESVRLSESSLAGAEHVVDIVFSPTYFEICISIGNHAIDHQEIDISRITSDSDLFELIWDKYNASRGIGLRRLFLRPRNVHFVLFSVSRHTQYGAGIHKKPDEFPPQEELDNKRYHYLCPKIRMPVNVFLHYLHRARWNIWGEHTEDTWLRRLPKKLNEGLLANISQDVSSGQYNQQDPPVDPNLAFGWGVHILDGPNHAVLGLMLVIGITISFVVSCMILGFAKTQEQGFGVGSFLLTVLASITAAVYFQLQDR